MSALRIAIIGNGKMGRAIAGLARERGMEVVATLGSRDNGGGSGITRERLCDADVAIEFTEPSQSVTNVLAALNAGIPIVVGTTGWYADLPRVRQAVGDNGGALLWAPNFSVGVTLFTALVERAGELFANNAAFAAHLIETHHAAKKDAPSGTAQALARAFARGGDQQLGVTSVRIGHVPGTHALVFDAPFEQIRLTHEARDRRVFADGALLAADWLRGKRGVFTMRDVLNLSADQES